jgi:hypothetical protein
VDAAPGALNNHWLQCLRECSMSDLPALPVLQPGRYRHFKGGLYEVVDVVRSSETLQPMVLYRALYGEGGLWVRPYAMFMEQVDRADGSQPRFARLDD